MASNDTRPIYLGKVCHIHYPPTAFVDKVVYLSRSMDGEVKLFDIRGSDRAIHTWDLFPHGLSAFDVHDLTGVFAA